MPPRMTRRRFTIAHEFGHYLLHEGISEHVNYGYRVNFRDQESSLARDVEEIEANFFAASLLMPRSMLDACGAVHAVDSDVLVRNLAKRFQVSQHAMSLRLANVYRRYTPF
jgi:Zn-dependent peptidase ImmA (M78 family)